jgi:YfiH family protein
MSRALAPLEVALRAAGLDWIVPDWPVTPDIRAFVTTRRGGTSTGTCATMNLGRSGDDEAAALAANRCRLDAFLPAAPVWLDQVHGTAVAVLDRAPSPGAPAPIADAAVTRERGIVCAVLVADCLPVLFADVGGTAVGVAHAGWRGLAAGVLEATVAAMGDLGTPAGDLVAWLGPGIGPDAFEVGDEVRAAFCDREPEAAMCFEPHRDGKWLANLCGLARRRLAAAGVPRVSGGGYCTYRDPARFFSYRRERSSGRMAALVWLAPPAPT